MNILGKTQVTYQQCEIWIKGVKTANKLALQNLPILWKCAVNNEHSQLGLNSTSSYKTSFTQVTENINNDVKQVICGWYHTFILKTNISIWCCGYNIHGQIGLGDTTDRYIFTTIPRGV